MCDMASSYTGNNVAANETMTASEHAYVKHQLNMPDSMFVATLRMKLYCCKLGQGRLNEQCLIEGCCGCCCSSSQSCTCAAVAATATATATAAAAAD